MRRDSTLQDVVDRGVDDSGNPDLVQVLYRDAIDDHLARLESGVRGVGDSEKSVLHPGADQRYDVVIGGDGTRTRP